MEHSLKLIRETLNARVEMLKKEARLEEKTRQAEEAHAAAEKLRMDQRVGVQRIADWAGEASLALVPLRMSPIQVAEPPASHTDALPVLDSAAERLRRLDQALGARLEIEGRELCRVVVEHVLTCFRRSSGSLLLASSGGLRMPKRRTCKKTGIRLGRRSSSCLLFFDFLM